MTSASSIQEAGRSKLVLWDNTKGWVGEGGWSWGSGWTDTCAPVGNSCQCISKNHHNIIKKLSSN